MRKLLRWTGVLKTLDLVIIITGIVSLAWFIIKTGTKPRRLTYPCQQVALNNSALFIIYILGLFGLKISKDKARNTILKTCMSFVYILALSIGAIGLGISLVLHLGTKVTNAEGPIGESKGSVVWIYNETATLNTTDLNNYWKYIDQDVVSKMMTEGILAVTNQETVPKAMAQIFKTTDCSDKTVAIKVNFVNDMNSYAVVNTPEAVISLLNLLTTVEPNVFSGFPQENIYIYDITKAFDNPNRKYFVTKIKETYPNVHVIGGYCYGGACDYGAEKATFDGTFTFPFSDNTGKPYCETKSTQYIATFLENSNYIINMPMFKGHQAENLGATLGFKNHFGTISDPRGAHDCISTFGDNDGLLGVFNATFKNGLTISNKTVLTIGEGLYSTPYRLDSAPELWDFFSGNPNSIFISTDPVAIDTVMYDIIMTEFELNNKSYIIPGQIYLEAAATEGFGIHEHPSFTKECSNKADPTCWKYDKLKLIYCNPSCPTAVDELVEIITSEPEQIYNNLSPIYNSKNTETAMQKKIIPPIYLIPLGVLLINIVIRFFCKRSKRENTP